MLLSDQDRGRTLEVSVGSVITVRLQENPGTGYRWMAETSPGLEKIGDRFEAVGAPGVAGVRELQLRAAQVGTYELRLKNRREWEGEGAALDNFDVRLIVK